MGQLRTLFFVLAALFLCASVAAEPLAPEPPRYRLTWLPMSEACALNDRGQVAGRTKDGQGILYTPGRKPRLLGNVPSHPVGTALFPDYLSNDGVVYGDSVWVTSGAITTGETVPFRWKNGKMARSSPGSRPTRFGNTRGERIASDGRGVFEIQPDDSVRYESWMAVLRRPDGTSAEMGTLGGKSSHALAISSNGKVVGWSETKTVPKGSGRAFLYDSRMRPLPLVTGTPDVPSTSSMAADVNRSGEIVGSQRNEAQGKPRSVAVYWDREGRAHDLNRLALANSAPKDASLRLYSATAINTHGQIIGQGSGGAFLLTPIRPNR